MSEQQQPQPDTERDEPQGDESQPAPEQEEARDPGPDGDGGEQQPETGRRPDFIAESDQQDRRDEETEGAE